MLGKYLFLPLLKMVPFWWIMFKARTKQSYMRQFKKVAQGAGRWDEAWTIAEKRGEKKECNFHIIFLAFEHLFIVWSRQLYGFFMKNKENVWTNVSLGKAVLSVGDTCYHPGSQGSGTHHYTQAAARVLTISGVRSEKLQFKGHFLLQAVLQGVCAAFNIHILKYVRPEMAPTGKIPEIINSLAEPVHRITLPSIFPPQHSPPNIHKIYLFEAYGKYVLQIYRRSSSNGTWLNRLLFPSIIQWKVPSHPSLTSNLPNEICFPAFLKSQTLAISE